MKRAITGMVLGLLVMGFIAALSGAATVDRSVEGVRNQWASVQSLPAGWHKTLRMEALRDRADELARRYPENADVKQWKKIVDRSYREMLRRRYLTG
jgi:hypothetical protein